MQRMIYFYLQGLLLLILLMVSSEHIEYVSRIASRQENVSLSCFEKNEKLEQSKCSRVRWIKELKGMETVFVEKPPSPNPGTGGGYDLYLENLKTSDEGLYSCEIWDGWSRIYVRTISLILKECKIRNLAKALRDKPILLKCPVNATAALKRSTHITWKKLIAGSPQDIQPKSEEVKINGTSLTIQFVNETTVGWYRCAYNLQDIQHCFDFNLQLQEPSKPATEHREQGSTGAHIAIVVSVIFVTASLSARAGQLIYRRYKERLAEEANRHEEGSFTGSDRTYDDVNSIQYHDPDLQLDNHLYNVIQEENVCT